MNRKRSAFKLLNYEITQLLNAWNSHTAKHSAHRGFHSVIHFSAGIVHRRGNQVLKHLQIPSLHGFGINLDVQDLLTSVHLYSHRAAAGTAVHVTMLHVTLPAMILPLRLLHSLLKLESSHP